MSASSRMISLQSLCYKLLMPFILLGPLFANAHPIEDDPLAKGGRGGGRGGGGSGSSNRNSVKMVNIGPFSIALWIVIVVGVIVGLLVLCCIGFIFKWIYKCFDWYDQRQKRANLYGKRQFKAQRKAAKDTDDGSGGIIITPAAGVDVEKGEFTQTHPSPFTPNYQITPASPYQIPEKQGEAQDYFNQPYGQGGMGYAFNQMNEVPQATTPSVGYTSRPTTPHHHVHTYSGSQVHLMGSPPVGYR